MNNLKLCSKCNKLRHEMFDCDCKMSIWKDPKVELPENSKSFECVEYIVFINSGGKLHTGYYYKDNKEFVSNDRFPSSSSFRHIKAWCYEEDLIRQAEGE